MKLLATGIIVASSFVAFSGELVDYYHTAHTSDRFDPSKTLLKTGLLGSTNHGVSEIGIERTVCFGSCPAYTFIARSDGSFRYKGEKHVERTGEYSGKISVAQFHKLAQFIRDSNYSELEDSYDKNITDQSSVFTMVVIQGKRKVVRDYANAGPTKLWAIEELIDHLMTTAEWKPGLPKAPEPLLPKVTLYDTNALLRAAYLGSFRVGYSDAWERKEKLPVFQPTSDVDKAKVFGYGDGMVVGRAALATWFGTNSPPTTR